jgi:WD40 repeat protein
MDERGHASLAARAEVLFLQLADLDPSARQARIESHRAADPALAAALEALLADTDVPDTFLEPALLPGLDVPEDGALAPGTSLHGFTVLRMIGTGASGMVYVAQQARPQRIVALKVLRRGLRNRSVLRRFELEAEMLGRLQHPGIAHILAADAGDRITPPFIAMELVDGLPITQHADHHHLNVADRLELIARVADAVHHAHQRGIIHRDLKPANILVTHDGQPKIVDFGIARAAGTELALTVQTSAGQILGTLPYMSPEQVRGDVDDIDVRTDVYALGVVLFRLIAGRLPFDVTHESLPQAAVRIAEEAAPRLGSIDRALAGDVETIVARALAKEKDRRYQSAADLAADLRRFLHGDPILARSDSALYVLGRYLQRYRRLATFAAVALLTLVAFAVYASVQRQRADEANGRLAIELEESNIERGRLLALTGNLDAAEALLWHDPWHVRSPHQYWALWDTYAHQPVLWTCRVSTGEVTRLQLSPDGAAIAAASVDGRITISPSDGRCDREVSWQAHAGPIRGLAYSRDGRTIYTGGDDGLVRAWRTADGARVTELERVKGRVLAMAVTGDGAELAVASDQGDVDVVEISSGRVHLTLAGPRSPAACVAASLRQRVLAAGFGTGELFVWELPSGRLVRREHAHSDGVTSVAFDPSGQRLATGALDQRVHVADALTGKHAVEFAPYNGTVRSLTFSDDGRQLAAAGWWRLDIWHLDAWTPAPIELGVGSSWFDAHFSADGRTLFTSSEFGTLRAWDLAPRVTLAHWRAHDSRAAGLAVSGDARLLATGGYDGRVSLWSPPGDAPTRTLASREHVMNLAMSADGRALAASADRPAVTLWDLSDSAEPIVLREDGGATAVAFTPDATLLLVGLRDGSLAVYEVARRRLVTTIPSSEGEALSLAVSPDGRLAALGHRGRAVTLHELPSGRLLRTFRTETAPFAVSFDHDGRMLAAGTWNGHIESWDLASGTARPPLSGHQRVVTSLSFSPDGAFLASSSRDGTVRLWDPAKGLWLARVAERAYGAERVVFFGSSERLAIAYDDGEVEIRDLSYFARHIAGQVAYRLGDLPPAARSSPEAAALIDWSRRVLVRQ